jgi:hypothetical protein
MKLTAVFRRVSYLDDDLPKLHQDLLTCVESLGNVWNFKLNGSPEIQPGELVSVCKIEGNKGLKGEVCYSLRSESYLRDESQYDDSISIELSCSEDKLISFYNDVFTKLVEAFSPYRAEIVVPAVARLDWQEISKATRDAGRDIYGRFGVYRIWPVSYYKKELLSDIPASSKVITTESGLTFNEPRAYFNNEYEHFSGTVRGS